MGTNAPRNTSTARGIASGTPRRAAPTPIPTASAVATMMVARTYAVRVCQPARAAVSRRLRAASGKTVVSHVQMRSPS